MCNLSSFFCLSLQGAWVWDICGCSSHENGYHHHSTHFMYPGPPQGAEAEISKDAQLMQYEAHIGDKVNGQGSEPGEKIAFPVRVEVADVAESVQVLRSWELSCLSQSTMKLRIKNKTQALSFQERTKHFRDRAVALWTTVLPLLATGHYVQCWACKVAGLRSIKLFSFELLLTFLSLVSCVCGVFYDQVTMLGLFSFCLSLHSIIMMFTLMVVTNSSSTWNGTCMPETTRWCGEGRFGVLAEALNAGAQDIVYRVWIDKKKSREWQGRTWRCRLTNGRLRN